MGADKKEQSGQKSTEKPEPQATPTTCPDGGWGWVVVFAAFMINFINDGVISCFGMYYPAVVARYDSSPALTSMASSAIVAVLLLTGPAAGSLIRRYGCRKVSFIGGVITTGGFIGAGLATNFAVFMLMYGGLGGVGMGMNFISSIVIVNLYFHHRRGIAGGIVSAGAGCGVLTLAPLTQHLLDSHIFSGAFLLTAGITMQFLVMAALMRPLNDSLRVLPVGSSTTSTSETTPDGSVLDDDVPDEIITHVLKKLPNEEISPLIIHQIPKSKQQVEMCEITQVISPQHNFSSNHNIYSDFHHLDLFNLNSLPDISQMKKSNNGNTFSNNLPRKRQYSHLHSNAQHGSQNQDPLLRKDIFYSGSLHNLKEFKEYDDCDTFVQSMMKDEGSDSTCSSDREPDTWACVRSVCDVSLFKQTVFTPVLLGAALIQMGQFIPSTFLPDYCLSIGLTSTDASLIIALYGALNIFGRLTAGCLSNVGCLSSLLLCNGGMFMCAVCCLLFPVCTTYLSLCMFACMFGYFIGFFAPLQVLIIVDYMGLERLSSALGFLGIAKAPAAFLGPPLAGLIYEWTRDYTLCFVFAGGLFLMSALVQSLVPLLDRCFPQTRTGNVIEIEINETEVSEE